MKKYFNICFAMGLIAMFMVTNLSAILLNNENSLGILFHSNIVVSPVIEWTKTFGGENLDLAWDIRQTIDNGYIIVGETSSFGAGGYDAWLIKTNKNGEEVWNKTFGGKYKDGARAICVAEDNGFALAGYTDSYGRSTPHDAWLIKTDSDGNELWNKTFGGSGSDAGFSIDTTNDNGYIICGYTSSSGNGMNDVWLIKTDVYGNEIWSKTFGGSNTEYGMSVKQTNDEGYIISGVTSSFGGGRQDAWLIKTDKNGNELWNKSFGGLENDWFGSVCQTKDEGFIALGDTQSFSSGGYDAWLIKTDELGNRQWEEKIGGTFWDETGYSISLTSDHGYITTGTNISHLDGFADSWISKFNANGSEQWHISVSGTKMDWSYSIRQTNDDGYIIAGYSNSLGAGSEDVLIIKLSTDKENLSPNAPTLNGPQSGEIGTSYTYNANTTDPNGDEIYYWFEWGDDTNSGWLGPYDSGKECKVSHTWSEINNYEIKAMAKDNKGAQSDWSTLNVIMPKKYNNPFYCFIERFLERLLINLKKINF